jgi:CheY-like chemotaxis protein
MSHVSPGRSSEPVILVVDDDPDCRLWMQSALRLRGWRAYGALHGPEALEIYEAVQPDVVLTDIWMPGISCTSFLHALRRLDPLALAVAVTALSPDDPRVLEVGATDISALLFKPFAAHELDDCLALILARRHAAAATNAGESGGLPRRP